MNGALMLTTLDLASLLLVLALAILFAAGRRLAPRTAKPQQASVSEPTPANPAAAAAETLARYRPAEYITLVGPGAASMPSQGKAALSSSDPAAAPLLTLLDPAAGLVEEALVGPESRTALRWSRSLVILLIVLVLLQRLLFG